MNITKVVTEIILKKKSSEVRLLKQGSLISKNTDIALSIHNAISKTTPADADESGIWDSVTQTLKKISFTNLKLWLTSLYVGLTGNQTIAGIKTFSSSPIVPAPTTDLQAATKKYVDDNGGAVDSVNGLTGTVVLTQDTVGDGTTYKQYSNTEKTKLSGIAAGAEVNVNADWNSVSGDSQILNKPTIPTALSELSEDTTHRIVTDTEKGVWNGKQNALGYTPENVSNLRTSFQVTPDDTHYISEKLAKDSLNAKQDSGSYEVTTNKDATGGYAGLTLFKINFKNALNTITSFFTNSNTVARTYTFQDRDGTIADNTDLAGKSDTSHNHSGVYEPVKGADDNYVTDAEKIVIGNTSGTNTGDNATNSQYSGLATSKENTGVAAGLIGTHEGTYNHSLIANAFQKGTDDLDDISDGATYGKLSNAGITDLTDGNATTLHKHSYNNLDDLPDINKFKTIAVSGQSDVVADSSTDTLTLAAGSNVTITTNATTDTITIASSGGGGGSAADIWYDPTGTYVSASSFSFSGDANDAEQYLHSLFSCYDTLGTTQRFGYIKSASESGGTVTCVVVTDTDLVNTDKWFKITPALKIDQFEKRIYIPDETVTDASNPQGKCYWIKDDSYVIPVDAAVRTAAAGAGAACAYNLYDDASNLFASAKDLTTNSTLVEQRLTTNTIGAGSWLSCRITSVGGATNYASDFEVIPIVVPQNIIKAA